MKTYLLDLTDVDEEDLPLDGELPRKIPCIEGQNLKDIDIDHDAVEDDWIDKIYEDMRKDDIAYQREHGCSKYFEGAYELPIGFNISSLPKGAKLIMKGEEERFSDTELNTRTLTNT